MKKILLLAISTMVLTLSLQAGKAYPLLESKEGIEFLNTTQIKEIFKDGTTIVGTNFKFNKEVVQNYKGDGTYFGTVASGKKKVSGKWFVEDNTICHTPKNKNKKKCREIYKKDDFYYELNGKKIIMNFKLK